MGKGTRDEADAQCTENDFGDSLVNITQVGNFKRAPYKYTLTPLKAVERVVRQNAGLGKIKV